MIAEPSWLALVSLTGEVGRGGIVPVIAHGVEVPNRHTPTAIARDKRPAVGCPVHRQEVPRAGVEPEPDDLPCRRPRMNLPDPHRPVAARPRQPATVRRERERHDPTVDAVELLEGAVGGQELTWSALPAPGRVRVPDL